MYHDKTTRKEKMIEFLYGRAKFKKVFFTNFEMNQIRLHDVKSRTENDS